MRQIIWEEREREGKRHAKRERHEKVFAGRSDPMWADEMGDGWGGVRDNSQRGLGPWEPLLLWSVKSTGSQWSTWPLQRAYSSTSACEGQEDTFSSSLNENSPWKAVHGKFRNLMCLFKSLFKVHKTKNKCSIAACVVNFSTVLEKTEITHSSP